MIREYIESIQHKKVSIAIMSSFVMLTIQYLFLISFNLINTTVGSNIQLASKAIVGLVYLYASPVVFKKHKLKLIGVYCLFIFLFLLNYLFYKENWIYLKEIIFSLFFICLPTFIYSYSIDDWDTLKDVMDKTSYIVFIAGSAVGVLVFTNNGSIGTYSMSLSYYLLLPAVIYFNDFLDKFCLKSFLILAISIFVILALGSRGAILCIGVFAILKIIIMSRYLNYKTILLYFLTILVLLALWLFLDEVLVGLNAFLARFGIHSRSINLFLRDNVYLSGRERLYEIVLSEIKDRPIFGVGLAGDRRIIGGGYVHNLFIELLANYGIIFGMIISIILVAIIFKGLFFESKQISTFIAIWLSLGFVPLMVSSSYLIDFKFWILLGLLVRIIFKRKTPDSIIDN